jgi:hypothetical protein
MDRFKMSFNSTGYLPPKNYSNLGANIATQPVDTQPVVKSRHVALNSPMIDRVYKAKAGCSACGKKVA